MSGPLVVASVVNWNTPALALRCLESLHALRGANVRIVLVDNASRGDDVAQIRARWPQLDIVRAAQNLGFGGGHALAWQRAHAWDADAIWLVNSDATAEPDALRRLVEAWRAHGDAIYGAAPLHRDADGTVRLNFPDKYLDPLGQPGPFRRDRPVVFDAAWQSRAPLRAGAVAGSCFFLPAALVRAHGWFDPAWFMYCEEIDYCYRLRAAGVASWLVPQARVWHEGGGSRRDARVDDCIAYYRARNEIELARRHAGNAVAGVTAAKKFARGLATLAVAPRRGSAILRGTRDALAGRFGKRLAPEDHLGDAR